MKATKFLVAAVACAAFQPLFSQPIFGQIDRLPPKLPAACGDSRQSMAVKLDKTQHTVAQPDSGRSQVYFIEDMGHGGGGNTTKIGMDGKWVGADKRNSYFSVSVAPGEHHLCAVIEPSDAWSYVELAHFTAEAGKIYYYRTRIIVTRDGVEYFSLAPLDSDAGEYAVSTYSMASAHLKK